MFVTDAHKKFVNEQLKKLEAYDSLRPVGHIYEFHLHSNRMASLMHRLSLSMEHSNDVADSLYWASLPHDIGKIFLPVEIWDTIDKPNEDEKNLRRTHTSLGLKVLKDEFGDDYNNDPFLTLMSDIMQFHHETLDGNGFHKLNQNSMSEYLRMACICDAFDGYSTKRPHYEGRNISPLAVIERMRTEKAGQFDSDILECLEGLLMT